MGYIGSNDRYVNDAEEILEEAAHGILSKLHEENESQHGTDSVYTRPSSDQVSLQALRKCFVALFNTLSDEQKTKVFDNLIGIVE